MINLNSRLENKFKAYYITAIFSLVFAVVGFSYNAWRMEVSEDNNNIRTAAFEVFTELAELQQLIYAAHFDQDPEAGNPRTGWVKVELIVELSTLIDPRVSREAQTLRDTWAENWAHMMDDRNATDRLVEKIDRVRTEIKTTLKNLP